MKNSQSTNLEYQSQKIEKDISIKDAVKEVIKFENETKIKEREEEIKYYDKIIEIVELILISGNYDTSILDNGEDDIIESGKMKIILTTTKNQENNINSTNMTILDLGECKTLLRNNYNISENETLYIKIIDVIQEGIQIPKIEYDVYYKFFGTNLTKLNISVCENSKIYISIPISISENLDKLNISSGYFNDICYSSTSDSGTDIILNDRKKDFVENNKTVCQEDCIFYDYNTNIKKANCSCEVKESTNSYANMNINKTKLYENIGFNNDNMHGSNLGITSCNVFSSTENIESNTGFFTLLFILAIFIIIFIIFCIKGYNLLENKMDEVIYKKFKNHGKNKKIKSSDIKPKQKQSKGTKKSRTKKNKNSKKIGNSTNKIFNDNKAIGPIIQDELNNDKKIEDPFFKPDTDYEINWLPYNMAIKFDKRDNCEYYVSLIKNKQLFLFTFCTFNDYNSGIIKKFMLFLSFALHYTINALFFTDSNFHQIYEDEGNYNFEYQISYILFSAIISTFVLRMILQFLVLTDKDILEVKNQQTKILANNMKQKKLKYMKIKFGIFFVLNFILLGLFWYYLTCFNAIYQNTQVYLIENTFISFAFSLFYPFVINIFPTIIRMSSLHSSDKNKEYLYKVSQIIQLI